MNRSPLFLAAEADDPAAVAAALDAAAGGGPAAPGAADARGPYGLTPLMRAAQKGSARALEALLARGASADATDDAGNTALMYAAARGRRACAEKLLAAGASVSHRNKFGLGPVDWAVWPADGDDVRDLVRD
ncbi:MAG: ankyrin repeat domain-containing protein [Azospirillum sp.]|jgi:ankyrin repeat protein|nr:ankyrin repeat domain-containing protein [Azospirillum sp.]MCZ8122688.1 ankyrin repeat domain-containing protein [Magnetospirillum sp.]